MTSEITAMEGQENTENTEKEIVSTQQEVLTQQEIDCLQNWRGVWDEILVQLAGNDGKGWLYHATQNYRTAYPDVDIDDFIAFAKEYLNKLITKHNTFSNYEGSGNGYGIYCFLCRPEVIQQAFHAYNRHNLHNADESENLVDTTLSEISVIDLNLTDEEVGYLRNYCETAEKVYHEICRIIDRFTFRYDKNARDDIRQDIKTALWSSFRARQSNGTILDDFNNKEETLGSYLIRKFGLARTVAGRGRGYFSNTIIKTPRGKVPFKTVSIDAPISAKNETITIGDTLTGFDSNSERESKQPLPLKPPYVLNIMPIRQGERMFPNYGIHAALQLYQDIDYNDEIMQQLRTELHFKIAESAANNDTTVAESRIIAEQKIAKNNLMNLQCDLENAKEMESERYSDLKDRKEARQNKIKQLTFLISFCPFHRLNKSSTSDNKKNETVYDDYNSLKVLEALLGVRIGANNPLIALYLHRYLCNLLFGEGEEEEREKFQEYLDRLF